MGKYSKLAKDIIKNVGGKENIKNLTHCVTRLRFYLVDESKADEKTLKEMKEVVSVVKSMGQFMVVIGDYVTEVYDDVMAELNLNVVKESKPEEKKKKSAVDFVISIMMAGMGPTLNLMCACGMIKALNNILTLFGVAQTSGIYMLLNAAGDSIFYMLPLTLGFNVAKKFDIDPFFGLMFGAALTYPALQGADLEIFGHVFKASYSSSFLPILLSMAIAVPVYKFFNKHIGKTFRGFLTPMLTILLTFPLAFCIIGPTANKVASMISTVITFLFTKNAVVGGVVLGFLWQILVLFGAHGMLMMFAFYDLIAGNPSALMALPTGATYGVLGTLLACMIKSKNSEFKGQSGSAFASAFMGITEPAMYGILAPNKLLLISACLGGAVGGIFTGSFHLMVYNITGFGPFQLLGFVNPNGNTPFLGIALAIIVSFIFSFIFTWLLYKENDNSKTVVETKESKITKVKMPVDGKIKPLSESTDSVFAQETVGKGCLVIPKNGEVYAPISGTVTTLFSTKHAVGITGENGVEVLVHIGINTVNLNGQYFETVVQQNDKVLEGDLLVKFNKEEIEKAGYSTEVPVIITNSNNYKDVVEVDNDSHNHGDDMLIVLE